MSDKKTFEQAMQELQEVVQKLESGKLGLEESLNVYKEGMELSKYCKEQLLEAKESVVTIMKDNQEVEFNEENK